MNQIRQIQSTLQMLFTSLEPSREKAMVSRWREEIALYGARHENRQKVLSAIKEDYDTLNEIIAATRLPRSTCFKIVRRLLDEDAITRAKVVRPTGNRSGKTSEYRYNITRRDLLSESL